MQLEEEKIKFNLASIKINKHTQNEIEIKRENEGGRDFCWGITCQHRTWMCFEYYSLCKNVASLIRV